MTWAPHTLVIVDVGLSPVSVIHIVRQGLPDAHRRQADCKRAASGMGPFSHGMIRIMP